MSDLRTKPPQSQLCSDLINIRLIKIDRGFFNEGECQINKATDANNSLNNKEFTAAVLTEGQNLSDKWKRLWNTE